MKKIMVLALVACPLISIAAPSQSEFEKRVVETSKWSAVGDQLKETLPGNVVKEFLALTEGVPYPAVKKLRNGVEIFISQDNGLRAVMQFKKDGVVAINKKDWKFEPLASVEEEVKRIEKFIEGETKTTGSFSFISDANAAMAGAAGIANLAFARGSEWKGQACGEKDLSAELRQDCPLMAVGMQTVAATGMSQSDKEKFLPIQLKCPADNGGTLELISKNYFGQAQRYRVVYKNDKGVVLHVSAAERNASFVQLLKIDLSTSTNSDERAIAKQIMSRGNTLLANVCKGKKQDRNNYFASLKSNKEKLLSATASNESGEVSETIDAL